MFSITRNEFRFECEEFESAEDVANAFGNGIIPLTEVDNVYKFIARAFHIMQQVGGKLTKNGKSIRPISFEQTGYDEASPQWLVRYGEKENWVIVELGSII